MAGRKRSTVDWLPVHLWDNTQHQIHLHTYVESLIHQPSVFLSTRRKGKIETLIYLALLFTYCIMHHLPAQNNRREIHTSMYYVPGNLGGEGSNKMMQFKTGKEKERWGKLICGQIKNIFTLPVAQQNAIWLHVELNFGELWPVKFTSNRKNNDNRKWASQRRKIDLKLKHSEWIRSGQARKKQ